MDNLLEKCNLTKDFLLENNSYSLQKEAQLIILYGIKYFVRLCEENNLMYYTAYGTTLGCVRHKGFIPWDEDADFYMPRESFEKFLKLDMDDEFVLLKPFYEALGGQALIYNTKYLLNGENRLYIDIFPLDDWHKEDSSDSSPVIKELVLLYLPIATQCFKYDKCLKCKNFNFCDTLNNINELNSKLQQYNNTGCSSCGAISFLFRREQFNVFDKDCFGEGVMLDFCNIKLRVPTKYHEMLTTTYGDYLTLPDESKRVSLHCKLLRELQKAITKTKKDVLVCGAFDELHYSELSKINYFSQLGYNVIIGLYSDGCVILLKNANPDNEYYRRKSIVNSLIGVKKVIQIDSIDHLKLYYQTNKDNILKMVVSKEERNLFKDIEAEYF